MPRAALLLIAALAGAACEAPAPPQTPLRPAQQAEGGVCEHAMPRAVCTRCNPALAAVFKAKCGWCAEHDWPESLCPICHPGAALAAGEAPQATPSKHSAAGAYEGRLLTLTSPDIERAAGLTFTSARTAQGERVVECVGQLAFDQERVAELRALVPGIVRAALVKQGDTVRRGEPLFELESREVSELQAVRRTAQARVKTLTALAERQRRSLEEGVLALAEVERTELDLKAARDEAAGVDAALRISGARGDQATGRYRIHAPLAGQIVARPATLGSLATAETLLARVVDTSALWAECAVPAQHAALLKLDQPLWGVVEGSDAPVRGQLIWISPEVDPHSRTVTARAAIPNPDQQLRANLFWRGQISVSPGAGDLIAVPPDAIQRIEDVEIVFVRKAPGQLEARVISRHGEARGEIWVKGRLKAGEQVVVTGAALLKTELLPGSIGAGCCEPAPGDK